MEAIGLHGSDMETMYGSQKLKDAAVYAKDIRDRYSVLWLYNLYIPEEDTL